jgi:hypothetical protein
MSFVTGKLHTFIFKADIYPFNSNVVSPAQVVPDIIYEQVTYQTSAPDTILYGDDTTEESNETMNLKL